MRWAKDILLPPCNFTRLCHDSAEGKKCSCCSDKSSCCAAASASGAGAGSGKLANKSCKCSDQATSGRNKSWRIVFKASFSSGSSSKCSSSSALVTKPSGESNWACCMPCCRCWYTLPSFTRLDWGGTMSNWLSSLRHSKLSLPW